MTTIVQVGYEKEKVAKQSRETTADIIKKRLEPIKAKDAQKVFEKLLAHVDRKKNVQIDIEQKKQEVAELKEQVESLQSEFEKTFDRNVMKAKIEVESEIEVIKAEVLALFWKSRNINNWTVDISNAEIEIVKNAYEPIGKKEQQLYAEMNKANKELVKAYEQFKAEYDKNTELHNSIRFLFIDGAARYIDLNRVSEHEINQVRQGV
jgi:hypothetical protein